MLSSSIKERAGQRVEVKSHDGHHSLAELIGTLRDDMVQLARQEVELGKREIGENVSRLSRNTIYLGAGALVSFLGLMFVILSLSRATSIWLQMGGLNPVNAFWLAPLIVGGGIVTLGTIALINAIGAFRHPHLVPDKTVDTLKEDARWAGRKSH
jgi:hypothetical protein